MLPMQTLCIGQYEQSSDDLYCTCIGILVSVQWRVLLMNKVSFFLSCNGKGGNIVIADFFKYMYMYVCEYAVYMQGSE